MPEWGITRARNDDALFVYSRFSSVVPGKGSTGKGFIRKTVLFLKRISSFFLFGAEHKKTMSNKKSHLDAAADPDAFLSFFFSHSCASAIKRYDFLGLTI